jgi:hypothetical protein
MGFKKGQSGNPNGKPIGSMNKTTKEIRESILKIVSKNIERFENDLDKLSSKDRVKIIVELIQYITPKVKTISYQETIEYPEAPDFSGFSTEELKYYMDKLCTNVGGN